MTERVIQSISFDLSRVSGAVCSVVKGDPAVVEGAPPSGAAVVSLSVLEEVYVVVSVVSDGSVVVSKSVVVVVGDVVESVSSVVVSVVSVAAVVSGLVAISVVAISVVSVSIVSVSVVSVSGDSVTVVDSGGGVSSSSTHSSAELSIVIIRIVSISSSSPFLISAIKRIYRIDRIVIQYHPLKHTPAQ